MNYFFLHQACSFWNFLFWVLRNLTVLVRFLEAKLERIELGMEQGLTKLADGEARAADYLVLECRPVRRQLA
jgi:hypothetical protein